MTDPNAPTKREANSLYAFYLIIIALSSAAAVSFWLQGNLTAAAGVLLACSGTCLVSSTNHFSDDDPE